MCIAIIYLHKLILCIAQCIPVEGCNPYHSLDLVPFTTCQSDPSSIMRKSPPHDSSLVPFLSLQVCLFLSLQHKRTYNLHFHSWIFFFSFFCQLLQCHTHRYCVLSCGVVCPLGASQFAPVCSVVFVSKHTRICVLLCISSSYFKVHTWVWNLRWLKWYLFMNFLSWYIMIVYFVGYSVMFQDMHIV